MKDFKVGQLWKSRNGYTHDIERIIDSSPYPVRSEAFSWDVDGSYHKSEISDMDLIELVGDKNTKPNPSITYSVEVLKALCISEIVRLDLHIEEKGDHLMQSWDPITIPASQVSFIDLQQVVKDLEQEFPHLGTKALNPMSNFFTLQWWTDNNLEVFKVDPCYQGLLLVEGVDSDWFGSK